MLQATEEKVLRCFAVGRVGLRLRSVLRACVACVLFTIRGFAVRCLLLACVVRAGFLYAVQSAAGIDVDSRVMCCNLQEGGDDGASCERALCALIAPPIACGCTDENCTPARRF